MGRFRTKKTTNIFMLGAAIIKTQNWSSINTYSVRRVRKDLQSVHIRGYTVTAPLPTECVNSLRAFRRVHRRSQDKVSIPGSQFRIQIVQVHIIVVSTLHHAGDFLTRNMNTTCCLKSSRTDWQVATAGIAHNVWVVSSSTTHTGPRTQPQKLAGFCRL